MMIERQAQRLASMVDEISDLARATRGRLMADNAQAENEVALLVDYARIAIGVANLPIENTAPDAKVAGDEARLVQLLRILLAAPYSPDAHAATCVHVSRDGDFVRIDVDCSEAEVPEVTPAELLQRPVPEPGDDGLGLGVVIAGAIAAAHGGRLDAEALAPGLRFILRLPAIVDA